MSTRRQVRDEESARLWSRPVSPREAFSHGIEPLGIGHGRDGLLFIPSNCRIREPAPLVVMLHGAGGGARQALELIQPAAEAHGVIVLAPESRHQTWDVIVSRFGFDVAFIDSALSAVFVKCAVDESRIGIAGFSDGASYALSLGLANGDLFTHVLAFSPGFMAPPVRVGLPRVFISHGVRDGVLPVEVCSRRVVPSLQGIGYEVEYSEFDDGHAAPPQIVRGAFEWFAGSLIPGSRPAREQLASDFR